MRPIHLCLASLAVALSTSASAQDGFLNEGGGITSGYDIGLDTDDSFLAGGGGISDDTEVFTSETGEFLEDGGGVSPPIRTFTSEREEFLEDGGGISSEVTVAPLPRGRYSSTTIEARRDRARAGRRTFRFVGGPAARTWRSVSAPGVSTSGTGSVITVSAAPRSGGHNRVVGGHGAFHAEPGPNVIDVESERLDRRPYPKSGIDIVITGGGSKIIRISPDF